MRENKRSEWKVRYRFKDKYGIYVDATYTSYCDSDEEAVRRARNFCKELYERGEVAEKPIIISVFRYTKKGESLL